jgi:hypothetical protein
MDNGKMSMGAIVPYFKVLLQNLSGRWTVKFVMWRSILQFFYPNYVRMNAQRPACCWTFIYFQYMRDVSDYNAFQLKLFLHSNCSSRKAISLCWTPQRPGWLWCRPSLLSNGYGGGGGGLFSRGKVYGVWSWPLTSIKCRGQEWWSSTFTPPYVFMAWCLIN